MGGEGGPLVKEIGENLSPTQVQTPAEVVVKVKMHFTRVENRTPATNSEGAGCVPPFTAGTVCWAVFYTLGCSNSQKGLSIVGEYTIL